MNWIVSRHPGVVEWIRSKGIDGEVIECFYSRFLKGDTYIGVLPVNMIADALSEGAEFILVIMPTIPLHWQDEALTPLLMDSYGAKLMCIRKIVMEEE